MDVNDDVDELIQDMAEKYAGQLGSFPETPSKDTQLKFMRDVVNEKDAEKQSKTANFTGEEAGKTEISVLSYFNIAQYAEAEGYAKVAKYLNGRALSVAAVSLGRKGKLIDTLFTVRRETRNLGTPKETKKKGLFGSTTVKEGTEV